MNRYAALLLVVSILAAFFISCAKKSPEDKLYEAQLALEKQEPLDAIIKAKEVIRDYPDDPAALDAHLLLADCYYWSRDLEQCRNHLNIVIEKLGLSNPKAQEALENTLTTYLIEGRHDAATTVVLNAMSKIPEDSPFYQSLQLRLAGLYESRDLLDKARDIYRYILEHETNQDALSAAMERLTATYAKNEQYDDAISVYEQFLDRHPDTNLRPVLLYGIAFFTEKKGEDSKAEELYEQSIKEFKAAIDETLETEAKVNLIYQLGRAYLLRGERDKALAELNRIINDFPHSSRVPEALFEIGGIYQQNREYDKAIEWFQKIEATYPQTQLEASARFRINEAIRLRDAGEASSPSLPVLTPSPDTAP